MKILIVSHDYAPMLSPQAFRWSAVARELARRGHHVRVVSGWEPGMRRRDSDGDVDVDRVGGWLTERVRNLYAERKVQTIVAPRSAALGANAFWGALKTLHDFTWKKLYWPDAYCTWFVPAVRRGLSILNDQRPDALVTVSLPFTSHLVGLALRRRHPDLRWVCDMSDPFSYLQPSPPNNKLLYNWLNYAAESEVFRCADKLAVNSDALTGRYNELYPPAQTKLLTVPNLFSIPLKQTRGGSSLSPERQQGKALRLVYVGTLDGRLRNPRPFLETCRIIAARRTIEHIETHVYGHIENCDTVFAPYHGCRDKWLFLHGPVPRRDATEAIAAADVLVNIGNTYQCQVPSKLVDYGSTGKPILNVVESPCDLSVKVLEGYKAVLNVVCTGNSPSDVQIAEAERFIGYQRSLTAAEVDQWLRPFTLPVIASTYERLLRQPSPLKSPHEEKLEPRERNG